MLKAQAHDFVRRKCLGDDKAQICDEMAISVGNIPVMLHRTRTRTRTRSRLRQSLAKHRD